MKEQVEADYQHTLAMRETENKQIVSSAEDMLFTTFTKELADKVRLSPRYVEQQVAEINSKLWELVKYFFTQWNTGHDGCRYEIDEVTQTVTATGYSELPVLFYYWDGSRNKPYRSQRQYGMASDFKPRAGRITLSSILGRGILHELTCPEAGIIKMQANVEPCRIGLYHVIIFSEKRRIAEKSVLVGKTDAGIEMDEEQCRELLALPVEVCTGEGPSRPQWLKREGRRDSLDELVPVRDLLAAQVEKLSPVFAEEAASLKLAADRKKATLSKELSAAEAELGAIERERDAITGDRLKRLSLDKRFNQLRREVLQRQENQFFDALRVDAELEEQLAALAGREKLTARVTREFIVRVECGE